MERYPSSIEELKDASRALMDECEDEYEGPKCDLARCILHLIKDFQTEGIKHVLNAHFSMYKLADKDFWNIPI